MPPRRKVRAAELARKNNDNALWRYLVLLIIVGGIFLLYMFKWSNEEEYDRFKKAREYSEYYKEFFVEKPLNYKVFDEMTLVIRATNLGTDFWNKQFYNMLRESENEVNEILDVVKLINGTHFSDGKSVKESQNLASFPHLYQLIKTGLNISENTLYNLAAGEIFDFWEREVRNYKRKTSAYSKAEIVAGYLFDNPSLVPKEIENRKKLLESLTKEKAQANLSVNEIIQKINSCADENFKKLLSAATIKPSSLSETEKKALLLNIYQHIKMYSDTAVKPKIENIKDFIPFAKNENIEINEAEKTVKILSPNTGINVSFFKEALFLKKLKQKLPSENFHYLIFLGDRHGMWRLPLKYMRWSVSIDDPFSITNKVRGAIKLMDEEGFFVVTRKNEQLIFLRLDELTEKIRKDIDQIENSVAKSEYVNQLKNDYPSRKYLFDPVKINISERFDTPVDWRTGSQTDKNLAAIVIDSDPVKARMLSYSLFISDAADIEKFESIYPETVFSILKSDNTVYTAKNHTSVFMTTEDIEKAKTQFDYRSRNLNPDGSVPEKK